MLNADVPQWITQVLGWLVAIVTLLGGAAALLVFIVRQVLVIASLRADLTRLSDAIERMCDCHDRVEKQVEHLDERVRRLEARRA